MKGNIFIEYLNKLSNYEENAMHIYIYIHIFTYTSRKMFY